MIESIGNHLWQSTVCAVAAAPLTWVLRRNRAQVRYCVWLAVSLKFLVPFSLLVVSAAWLAPPAATRVGSFLPAVEQASPLALATAVDKIGRPFSGVRPATRAERRPPVRTAPALAFAAVISGIWLVGCSVVTVVWLSRWRRAAAIVRRAAPLTDGREGRALARIRARWASSPALRVVRSEARVEPGVFGIFHPVLVWPQAITAYLSDSQLEAILVHELSHVRRRDNLVAAIHALVQAAFWFHPILWWIGARLVAERERACDEEVVRLGADPHVYAESILEACRFSFETPRLLLAGATASDLQTRLESILENPSIRPLGGMKRLLLAATALAAVAVPFATGIAATRLRAAPAGDGIESARFGPRELNRLIGFELLPGPAPRFTDDPKAAVAWNVSVEQATGRTALRGFTGRGLIRYAYHLGGMAVLQGPAWLDRDSIDVSSTTAGLPADDDVPGALRRWFADQTQLAMHRETRRLPVYALVQADASGALGPALRQSANACLDRTAGRGRSSSLTAGADHDPGCGVRQEMSGFAFERITIPELADALSRSQLLVDRPVVDRTGLAGVFDGRVNVGFVPAAAMITRHQAAGAVLEPLGVRTLFAAVRDELGLMLIEDTIPGDVLVLDRVERPAR
jgi:bla regulator protein BlaR1